MTFCIHYLVIRFFASQNGSITQKMRSSILARKKSMTRNDSTFNNHSTKVQNDSTRVTFANDLNSNLTFNDSDSTRVPKQWLVYITVSKHQPRASEKNFRWGTKTDFGPLWNKQWWLCVIWGSSNAPPRGHPCSPPTSRDRVRYTLCTPLSEALAPTLLAVPQVMTSLALN